VKKKICKSFPRLLKNVIIQTNEQTSQQADDLAPWSCWLHLHRTPFIPCWGDRSSSSSQHASRRVLPSADELKSRRADELTSRRADEPMIRLPGLVGFVGIVLRSSCAGGRDPHPPPQHASRRVLCSAEEDGYIPDWGRQMVVVVVVGGGGGGTECRTQHASQHVLHSMCCTARYAVHCTARYTARCTVHHSAARDTARALQEVPPCCFWSLLV
jgi:hypothetical protein